MTLPTAHGRHRLTVNNWPKKKTREKKFSTSNKPQPNYTTPLLIVLSVFIVILLGVVLYPLIK